MDWDLKMPPWDLAELETYSGPSLGSVVGTSTASAGGGVRQQPKGPDCSVDLKLGGLGDFDSARKTKGPVPAVAVALPSPPPPPPDAPSKRPRAAGSGGQTPSCLVDGCRADLSKCREYHRRHKVCEGHSKTPIVMVGGREQRFCQQCSRFHLLVEFDEAKRSCRKRLEGHNRRRRKPPHDPINSGSFMTGQQATRFSPYPPIFPTVRLDPNWTGIIKSEDGSFFTYHDPLHLNRRQSFGAAATPSYRKGGRPFPFLQDGDADLGGRGTFGASVCQPLLKTSVAPSESRDGGGGSSSKMFRFPDGLTQVLDSDCALSLLSSPTPTPAFNMSPMVQSASQIPMGQPLVSNLQYNSSFSHFSRPPASGAGHERLSSFLVASNSNDSELNYQGIFHVGGGEGSSDGASQPPLPFSWQ